MNSSLSLRTWIGAALAVVALGAHAQGAPDAHDAQGAPDAHDETLDLERITEVDFERMTEIDIDAGNGVTPVDPRDLREVNRIPIYTRLHSWTAIDDDTLIVWASPSMPYLIELARPVPQLSNSARIGLTSRGREVRAGFDSVEIDGFRYPIAEIYEVTRDDAETLQKDENFTGVY